MTEKSTSFKPNIVTTNELQWTDIKGSVIVGAQGMANNAHVPVADIALVLQGKSLADMSCLDFCDPNHFRAGKLNAIHHNGLHCQMIWTTIAYPKSVIGILTVWMLSRFLLCLRVLTKERITSVVVHHTVFSPITYHANRLLCLYLICSWTICVLRLFPFGAKSENAPHLANGISVTMIEYFIFELKTVHFLLIVSNICLTMFIKVFNRQCVTTSHDVSLLWLKGYFMLKISPLIFEYMTVHGIYLHL